MATHDQALDRAHRSMQEAERVMPREDEAAVMAHHHARAVSALLTALVQEVHELRVAMLRSGTR